MWICRTKSAPWAGRYGHTSVVDASGAIYVIGGDGSTDYYHDVWVSPDRGARAGLGRGGVGGDGRGVDLVGTTGHYRGYCRGTWGYYMVLKGGI
jgi:hypothetical protein